jgi:hypothetical protein
VHGSHEYLSPRVTDYGNLWAITAVVHPLQFGGATPDLSFSSPSTRGISPGFVSAATGSGGSGSGGTPGAGAETGLGGGGSDGGGSGSGELPFTGLAVGAVAAIGAGLAGAGGTMRRAVRRSSRRSGGGTDD